MSSREMALILFACIFGSTLLGLLLGKFLPDRHLESDSKDIVKLATGLIATLSALVLGLLITSAKESFDSVNNELAQTAVQIVVLDRVLAQYGPEAKDVRAALKSGYSTASAEILSGDESQQAKLDTPAAVARLETIQARLRALSPKDDAQHMLQSRAIAIADAARQLSLAPDHARKGFDLDTATRSDGILAEPDLCGLGSARTPQPAGGCGVVHIRALCLGCGFSDLRDGQPAYRVDQGLPGSDAGGNLASGRAISSSSLRQES